MEQRIKQIMSDILDVEFYEINANTSVDSTSSWDSLAHINLMSAIEQEFEIELTVAEIESMHSYRSIIQHLNERIPHRSA